MDYEQAVASGAMALFGEKYESQVRVLNIGEFSTELCGGTHVQRAGDIGVLRITSESGVAAGVRRIEAVTGQGALDHITRAENRLREVAALVRGNTDDAVDKVREQLERVRSLEKELRVAKDKLASGQGTDLASSAITVGNSKIIAATVAGADSGALRATVDQLKSQLGSAVIVLSTVESPEKVILVAAVTNDLTSKIKAGEIISALAAKLGGKGGGRPDFAQGGGSDARNLPQALAEIVKFIGNKVANL
jgi:alanyl-tRNA synthetase